MTNRRSNEVPARLSRVMAGVGILLPLVLITGIVSLWPPQKDEGEFHRLLEDVATHELQVETLRALVSPDNEQTSQEMAPDTQPDETVPADDDADDDPGNDDTGNDDQADTDDDQPDELLANIRKLLNEDDEGQGWRERMHPEVRLILLVLLTGALGSYIHMASSFVDYVGNRRLAMSWVPWYFLRPFSGAVLAFLFYFCIRGGFLSPQTEFETINVFGILAIAGLAGLFSKQASDKLEEIFNTMFKTEKDAQRRNKLAGARPEITGLLPTSATAGAGDIEVAVIGTHFDSTSLVQFDGDNYEPTSREDSTRLTFLVKADKLQRSRPVDVVVINAEEKGGPSTEVTFHIFAKPNIESLSPGEIKAGAQNPLDVTITGENFLEQSVVDFGGKTIKPTRRREQTELVIQLTPTDLAHARSVEVRVVNGPNRGGDSDPAPFEITQ